MRRDLLGPAGGAEEEITERNARGRYIVGLLAPRGQSVIPDLEEDLADAGGDDQDGKMDTVIPQLASMLPSSIGLSFTVDGAAETIQITARWGHYQRTRSETQPLNEKGEPRAVWKRRPVEGVSDPLPLQEGAVGPWHPESENQEVYGTGRCRSRGGVWSVTLFLVNAQQEPKTNKDEAWLFQPELAVQASDDAPIFIKRQLPPELSADSPPEDRAMAMLYRRSVEFGVGHGFHKTAQGIRYTVSEAARRELLTRLLKLNHERYAEEVRLGLHGQKTKVKRKSHQEAQPK